MVFFRWIDGPSDRLSIGVVLARNTKQAYIVCWVIHPP